ncbi:hypothetical protein AN189_17060, partial [Loktanella sp. 3ANDIMAR09]
MINGELSTGIGFGTVVEHDFSTALGTGATTTSDNQVVLGVGNDNITAQGVFDAQSGMVITDVVTYTDATGQLQSTRDLNVDNLTVEEGLN